MSLNFAEMRSAFHTGSTVAVGLASTLLLAADTRRIAVAFANGDSANAITVNAPSPAVFGDGFLRQANSGDKLST